jgi:hypothetical protein
MAAHTPGFGREMLRCFPKLNLPPTWLRAAVSRNRARIGRAARLKRMFLNSMSPRVAALALSGNRARIGRAARLKRMFLNSMSPRVAALALCIAFAASAQEKTGPTQPIPFSHLTHVGEVKLACADCHVYPAKFGDAVGIPDAPRCLECHRLSTKEPPTRATLSAFAERKQPIPWVRVFALRDFVFFDHLYHLQSGAECEQCHGPISTEDVVSDRLGTTKMTFCQPCHVKMRAPGGCTTCHDQR